MGVRPPRLNRGVRLHEDGAFQIMIAFRATILAIFTSVSLTLAAHAGANAPRLPSEQEAALRARVNSLYTAWGSQHWRAMFKHLLPGDQKCGRVSELADELGGESGERPVGWQILQVRADPESPHHKEPSDCSQKVWKIDAVAWVQMSATFENQDGSRSVRENFENAWLLIDGKWYWSPSEV